MNLTRANFFWHGDALSLQEYVCISSFINNGFAVHLYSYSGLNVPEGAQLHDASEILPVSHLGKYTQAGMPANITAFSDAFRYHVIKEKGGWWFDTDVVCLAKADTFAKLVSNKEIKISAGYQSPHIINGGVLYVDDASIMGRLIDELENAGTEFEWGGIGPTLFTRVINELKLSRLVESEECYYPIPYTQFRRMYEPESESWCQSRIKGSLTVHLWNEIRRRDRIPNSLMPPVGSFLRTLFITVCPELESMPAMPFETVKTLFDYSDLKDEHRTMVREQKRLAKFESDIKNGSLLSSLLALRSHRKRG